MAIRRPGTFGAVARRMRLWLAFALAACAGRYRSEFVGTAPVGDAGIALARGVYDLDVTFDVPRAQVVAWQLVGGGGRGVARGVAREGVVGETFEADRARRIGE